MFSVVILYWKSFLIPWNIKGTVCTSGLQKHSANLPLWSVCSMTVSRITLFICCPLTLSLSLYASIFLSLFPPLSLFISLNLSQSLSNSVNLSPLPPVSPTFYLSFLFASFLSGKFIKQLPTLNDYDSLTHKLPETMNLLNFIDIQKCRPKWLLKAESI